MKASGRFAVLQMGSLIWKIFILSLGFAFGAEDPAPGGQAVLLTPVSPSAFVVPTNMLTDDSAFGSGTLRSAGRVQLVYGGAMFPTGALAITELRLRPDSQYGSAFVTTLTNLEVRLSTTLQAPDALSAAFAQNVGADETVVFSGPITLSSAFAGPPQGPKAFDIVIPLAQSFVYAPRAGNLLVEFRNAFASTASLLSGQGRSDDLASRVVGSAGAASGGRDSGAEALQLVYYPTNEPPLPPPRLTRGPYLQRATTSNIVVRWRTSQAADSRVHFGLAADALVWEVHAAGPTTEHLLALTNLAPDTRYFYAIGTTEAVLSAGPDHHFFTHPLAPKPVRIWAIGDSGTANQPGYQGLQARVRDAYYAHAGARPTDVWLMLGDNAYLSGLDQEFQDTLFDIYPTLLRRTVLWPTIGNHDVTVSGGNYTYLNIFTFPTQGEAGGVASGSRHYYSFDYANIHFVCLDSEDSDPSPGGAMLSWLEQDLAANTNDWLIAFWHSPAYSFGTHDSDNPFDTGGHLVQMRENAVPLLEAHGVDLVLCGHSHNYERSYLLDGHYGYSWTLMPTMLKDAGSGRTNDTGAYRKATLGPGPREGAVHVICGSSGWVTPDIGKGQHPAMFMKLRELGSLVIDVNSNRLDCAFLRDTGAVDDYFTMIKGGPPEPLRLATFRVNGGVVRAQWKSIAGQTYRIDRSPGLEPPDWRPASGLITATGATTGWTNAVPPGAAKSFYRVVRVD
jgi:hypothetical protein